MPYTSKDNIKRYLAEIAYRISSVEETSNKKSIIEELRYTLRAVHYTKDGLPIYLTFSEADSSIEIYEEEFADCTTTEEIRSTFYLFLNY